MVLCSILKSPSYSLPPTNLSKLLITLLVLSLLSMSWIMAAALSLSLLLQIVCDRYCIQIPFRRSSNAVRTSIRPVRIRLSKVELLLVAFDTQLMVFHTSLDYDASYEHPKRDIKRKTFFDSQIKLIIVLSYCNPIQMLVAMPFHNLEFCDSNDSSLGIYITSRFPVNSATVELLTFAPPTGDSPEGILVRVYWLLDEFPLPEQLPTAYEDKFALLIQSDANVKKIALLLKIGKNNIQAQQKKKMVKSSSKNEACCSKTCKKNIDTLNSKIAELSDKLSDTKTTLYHYKLGLSQVEARLVEFKNQEIKLCEKIKGLEFKVESRGFQSASKDLDSLLESQRSDKNKEGLGYSDVPPPPAQVYSPPKKDMSWTGLPEFTDDTVTDYIDIPTERPTTNKVKTAKKLVVKYAELYRKPSKKSTVRGNQRNWNNLKSQQLGTKRSKGSKSTKVVVYILQVKKKLLTKKLEDSEAEHQV
nr:hypothetical protein [Tanacetum cinerariifolium]